jgi:iron complex transport system ATP-binding protein
VARQGDEKAQFALVLTDVSATYSGGTNPGNDEPLVGVSLAIGAGELACVLGPNGAGKSTLLRVMSGTLPASRGEVTLLGEPMARWERARLARHVAVVPQTSEVAFGYSVRDVVMMGRAPHQDTWMHPSADDERVVKDALARCDAEGLADRRVDELSGGEQKRVAIARALAQTPDVLLLDEPGAFLDVRHQVMLYDLLDEVRKTGMACVVVMHDLNTAAQYATNVLLMKRGRLVASGTIEQVMTYARLKETFDADLYCGVNDVNDTRFFLPMRGR